MIPLPKHPGSLDLRHYRSSILENLESPVSDEAIIDKKSHIFCWAIKVPDKFGNIIILDASGNHRSLEQYDSSIRVFPMLATKSYSDVTIHYCKTNVGRNTVDNPEKNTPMYKELAHIVSGRPKDERVVCFHLPDKEGVERPPHKLNNLLDPKDIGVVTYKSWGESKGINSLRDRTMGIHIGMVFRDSKELSTAIAAQKRMPLEKIKDKERHQVQVNENAEQVYQAMNRLECRKTDNGKALPTDFYLFYPDDKIISELKILMPDVVIKDYTPKYLNKEYSAVIIADKIYEWIKKNNPGKTSIKVIRETLGFTNVRRDTTIWLAVRRYLEQMLPEVGYILPKGARSITPVEDTIIS